MGSSLYRFWLPACTQVIVTDRCYSCPHDNPIRVPILQIQSPKPTSLQSLTTKHNNQSTTHASNSSIPLSPHWPNIQTHTPTPHHTNPLCPPKNHKHSPHQSTSKSSLKSQPRKQKLKSADPKPPIPKCRIEIQPTPKNKQKRKT